MKTDIVMVIDKSGSMSGIKSDAIGSFNQFLEGQQKVEGEASLYVTLFDTNYSFYAEGVDIKDAKPFTEDNYLPGGGTALLDAVGKTINEVEARSANKGNNAPKVLFAILTDGEENSSREYSYDTVSKLIERKTAEGWQFIFLAAGLDAAKEAVKLGVNKNFTVSYADKNSKTYNTSNMVLNSVSTSFRSMDKSTFDATYDSEARGMQALYSAAIDTGKVPETVVPEGEADPTLGERLKKTDAQMKAGRLPRAKKK